MHLKNVPRTNRYFFVAIIKSNDGFYFYFFNALIYFYFWNSTIFWLFCYDCFWIKRRCYAKYSIYNFKQKIVIPSTFESIWLTNFTVCIIWLKTLLANPTFFLKILPKNEYFYGFFSDIIAYTLHLKIVQ